MLSIVKQGEKPGPGYIKMMKSEGKVDIYPNFHVDKNGQEWAHQVCTGRVGAPTEILLQNEANQQSEQKIASTRKDSE